MIARILLIALLCFIIYLLIRWFIRTPPQQVKQRLKQAGLFFAGGAVIVLALTGKLHWLFALLGGLIPFAQRLFTLFKGYQMFKNVASQFKTRPGGPTPGSAGTNSQKSTITTAWLKMTLDHDSGDLYGLVLTGRFRGKQLEEMPLPELIALLADCRTQDEESANLLETYLDRRFGEQWREQFHHEHTSDETAARSAADISLDEAYEILGLNPGASLDDIKTAHKRLIQKLHPDRGGSSYLAAKINKAKDILVAHLEEV